MGEIQPLQELSPGEKWRATRALCRGESPADPRVAAAAVELAKVYQRRGPVYSAALRWLPVLMIVLFGGLALSRAVEQDVPMAVVYGLIAAINGAQFYVNPATRPRNMARCLEASRRVVAADG